MKSIENKAVATGAPVRVFLVVLCVGLSTKAVPRRVKAMRVKIVAWASVVCWAAVWNCPGRLFACLRIAANPVRAWLTASVPASGTHLHICLHHQSSMPY
jgi:predicted metal-binding protein